ncbi:MAG: diadenylate cyclase CdaA [Bryobacteraceae bacterium]|nr:diadenylate cyclase CdaA [Bryobacteraceae bacterium]
MQQILAPILEALQKLDFRAVIDILAVGFLIYQFVAIIRGRRAVQILTGLMVLLGVYIGATYAGLELLRTVLLTVAPYTAFALIVMFQSEIRRLLARIGRSWWLGFGGRAERRESIDEILMAVEQMARTRTGALIVVERDAGLRTFIESGVMMDALLSRDLLLAIFHPGAAMHDGAVIIQGERIAAAACFLPLTTNPAVASTMGTRHRAAMGVTEESDCVAIVVSEETGWISVASQQGMERNITVARLEERLAMHFTRGKVQPVRNRRATDVIKEPTEHPR